MLSDPDGMEEWLMTAAIDYSFVRYTAAQLDAAGVDSVIRYLGPPGTPKAISKAELDTLVGGGIAVGFVFEVSTDDATGGYAIGVVHSTQAAAYLAQLGVPSSQPVYFAVDKRLTTLSPAVAYFQGIASCRAAAEIGCYGQGSLTLRLRSLQLVGYTWQSASTSYPGNATTLPTTNVQQGEAGPLPTTDLDVIRTSDWGQYPRPAPPAPPPSTTAVQKPLTGRYGTLNKPIVALCPMPTAQGYTLVGSDGGTFNYGTAPMLGSLANDKLNAPIVNAVHTADGKGLLMVATDGGVFALGDAPFEGSEGGKQLNAPVVSIALTPDGKGYWLVAADGGVFAFGDAPFKGSMG